MKIGIGLPNQVRDVDARIIPTWAAAAESAGFSTLSTVGRFAYPGVADTVTLAAAAATTSTIGLFTGVLEGPVWPPRLLAKELAGIDAVSGGRLTLGVGLGGRPEDFVAEGHGPRGTGARLDRDIEIYRRVWSGEPIDGTLPAVTRAARPLPLIIGGHVQASFDRAARVAEGYVAGTVPAAMVAPSFESVRTAWKDADRDGAPRLIALAYVALGDAETGRANVHHYYRDLGEDMAGLVVANVAASADAARSVAAQFAEIGADELIFVPATDDADDVSRLADAVL
ncbi:LLM class flavin-dependent oxidoreductase [Kineosporia succinea]|uniref:Alkanesulfonate monooxygenase SsuD/methylene tetrahydromethanopterin reductase-like flavin-dependent oxidoreductase (Luciferase family) n=1 Tax=Kineosporia succinea TaxID=84632 RepID=A0ABT9PC33_9ACTN|nr:LLM class flavin-dependent oxidoreductase [Kineosporia succinea]MDP9830263.1 alkanesulfonate monooxygenase SsuD/methylene tetrahydromethanopterin reductase-like flavin-dependent oxidoreductase (luciferase family) [Kineosporia succinea]